MDYIDSIIKESKKNLESSPLKTIGELEHPSAEDILSRPGCTDGAISSRGFGEIED